MQLMFNCEGGGIRIFNRLKMIKGIATFNCSIKLLEITLITNRHMCTYQSIQQNSVKMRLCFIHIWNQSILSISKVNLKMRGKNHHFSHELSRFTWFTFTHRDDIIIMNKEECLIMDDNYMITRNRPVVSLSLTTQSFSRGWI